MASRGVARWVRVVEAASFAKVSNAATPIKQVVTITERGLRASNMAFAICCRCVQKSELI